MPAPAAGNRGSSRRRHRRRHGDHRLPRSGHAAPRLIREDGTEMLLALDVAALPARVAVAVDRQPIAQCLLTLPPLPAGGHTLHFDDDPEGACRIVVAPDRCYLPADLRGGARRFGLAAQFYRFAATAIRASAISRRWARRARQRRARWRCRRHQSAARAICRGSPGAREPLPSVRSPAGDRAVASQRRRSDRGDP